MTAPTCPKPCARCAGIALARRSEPTWATYLGVRCPRGVESPLRARPREVRASKLREACRRDTSAPGPARPPTHSRTGLRRDVHSAMAASLGATLRRYAPTRAQIHTARCQRAAFGLACARPAARDWTNPCCPSRAAALLQVFLRTGSPARHPNSCVVALRLGWRFRWARTSGEIFCMWQPRSLSEAFCTRAAVARRTSAQSFLVDRRAALERPGIWRAPVRRLEIVYVTLPRASVCHSTRVAGSLLSERWSPASVVTSRGRAASESAARTHSATHPHLAGRGEDKPRQRCAEAALCLPMSRALFRAAHGNRTKHTQRRRGRSPRIWARSAVSSRPPASCAAIWIMPVATAAARANMRTATISKNQCAVRCVLSTSFMASAGRSSSISSRRDGRLTSH